MMINNSFTPFLVEEVLNFTQVDLVTDDVMLLDTGDTMFAWLGIDANKVERNAVLVTAKDYLLSDPSGKIIYPKYQIYSIIASILPLDFLLIRSVFLVLGSLYLGYVFLTLGRNVDIPIIVVKQGFEPPHFKG